MHEQDRKQKVWLNAYIQFGSLVSLEAEKLLGKVLIMPNHEKLNTIHRFQQFISF